MTKELFREDGYMQSCEAYITHLEDDKIGLDQTVFYPMGGGQPGDQGVLIRDNGERIAVLDTIKDRQSGQLWHIVESTTSLKTGDSVHAKINWQRRYQIMRLHSCMHMLCAVVPAPVTGGSISDTGTARLDFNLPEPPDKQAMNEALNQLTSSDHPMTLKWISDDELKAQPELVRTMSVQPPMGAGKVRLVEFSGVDLQPCGGTHVANSKEIGEVIIQSINKKGKLNRRVTIALAS